MKLLVDHNLPPRLIRAIEPQFPGSVHVADVGLAAATDEAVWEYAREHGFTIISKDSDFHQRSFVRGYPPRVVWLRRGNCGTHELIAMVQEHAQDILWFGRGSDASFLVLD